jgi:lysophospholipase L1-like esterase
VSALALLGLALWAGAQEQQQDQDKKKPAKKAEGKVLKVMPLGDSLTAGGATGGYRGYLAQKCAKVEGVKVELVGSQQTPRLPAARGPWSKEDRERAAVAGNHEGHRGAPLSFLERRAAAALKKYKPDVVLLLAGGNDVARGAAPKAVAERLGKMIDRITTALPEARVFVGSYPPTTSRALRDNIAAYSAAIPAVVKARADKGKKVTLVDMSKALTDKDLDGDGIHPNRSGCEKMAQAWSDAMSPVLTGKPAPKPKEKPEEKKKGKDKKKDKQDEDE